MNISIFKNIKQTKNGAICSVFEFLQGVKTGYFRQVCWADIVDRFRAAVLIGDSTEEIEMPYITPAGIFSNRNEKGLENMSGIMPIDIDLKDNSHLWSDDLTPESLRDGLFEEIPQVLASFLSRSGKGVCLFVRIPERKEDYKGYFLAISKMLFDRYNVIVDRSGSDITRARYISFDPELKVRENARVWDKIEVMPEIVKKTAKHSNERFNFYLEQIQEQGHNIAESYNDWFTVGVAFARQFGEDGRVYFHVVSQNSSKYNPQQTDSKYNYCLKAADERENGYTMGSFYKLCADAGIKYIKPESQVFVQENEVEDTSKIGIAKAWLRKNKAQYNRLKHTLTVNGNDADLFMLNSIYLKCIAEAFGGNEKGITKDLFNTIALSDNVENFHPFEDFLKKLTPEKNGLTDRFLSCIPVSDEHKYFIKKWLVGIISALNGTPSPLMLIFTGEKRGKGKTEFFRNLLPNELLTYFGEGRFDQTGDGAKKDFDVMFTNKILIMLDEIDNELSDPKKQAKIKDLLAKKTFSVRLPYGSTYVDLKRWAVVCGTSNVKEIIIQAERRFIPVSLDCTDGINWRETQKIDKFELFRDLLYIYNSGYNWQVLDEDIDRLEALADVHKVENVHEQILLEHFEQDFEHGNLYTMTSLLSDLPERLGVNPSRDAAVFGRAARNIGWISKRTGKGNFFTLKKKYI